MNALLAADPVRETNGVGLNFGYENTFLACYAS